MTFKKGDLITVTQKEDGGWWEGTSHETGKTGWFPSNYVKEIEENSTSASGPVSKPETAQEILAKQVRLIFRVSDFIFINFFDSTDIEFY